MAIVDDIAVTQALWAMNYVASNLDAEALKAVKIDDDYHKALMEFLRHQANELRAAYMRLERA